MIRNEELLERLKKGILPLNRGYLNEYMRQLRINNPQDRTVNKLLYSLMPFTSHFGKKKDFKKLEKIDLENFIIKLNNSTFAYTTQQDIKRAVKRFCRSLGLGEYVRFIRLDRHSKGIPRENLLTTEQIKTMINSTKSLRDKTIIALLAALGCRPGELLTIKRRSIFLDDYPIHIVLNGKTGSRTVPLEPWAETYLRTYLDWLDENIDSIDPEATIWPLDESAHKGKENLGYGGFNKIILTIAEKTKLPFKIKPYTFRHSALTEKAKIWNERLLIKFFGTHELNTYIHHTTADLDEAILKQSPSISNLEYLVMGNIDDRIAKTQEMLKFLNEEKNKMMIRIKQ